MADRLKCHTKDPVRRAADIANREAETACQGGENCRKCNYFSTWLMVFESALKEFSWPGTITKDA